MGLHIRKGDTVMVVSGREKGKQGKVIRIQGAKPHKPGRVFIEKLAMVKRHTKPSAENRNGGILTKESSIAISSVLPICPKEDRPVRVKAKIVGEKKTRVCAKCGEAFPS
jgi:large subunit ribosomal protein L24